LKSKKPSAITRLREETVFFLDRTLGKFKCAEALTNAGFKVKVHDECFPTDAPDEVWLAGCGVQNWVAITGDQWGKGRKGAAQMKAAISGKVRIFQLSTNAIPAELWAHAIIRRQRKIFKILKKNRGPFIARITPGGTDIRVENIKESAV